MTAIPTLRRISAAEDVACWVAWMRASGAPATTISLRRYYVTRLTLQYPDALTLSVDQLAGWLGSSGWSPNTCKSARSSLRSFYGWAVTTGRISTSPAHLLPAVKVPRGRPKPAPEAAYRHALDTADARVLLAVQLAGGCGLRRSEVARVAVEDVEVALSRPSLRVVGKGGHVRMVPLPDDLAHKLLSHGSGYVFPSPRGGHISPHYLAKLVTAVLEVAPMHALRHRCATVAYAATHDLRAVQELLGHSRPETTAGYVQVPDEAVRAAMKAAVASSTLQPAESPA